MRRLGTKEASLAVVDAVVTVVKGVEDRGVWGMKMARMSSRRGTRNQRRPSEENADDCLRGVLVTKWGVIQVTFCGFLASLPVFRASGVVNWRVISSEQVLYQKCKLSFSVAVALTLTGESCNDDGPGF